MKKQEFKKMKRLRNLWDKFKHPNIQIIGVPEGEEKEQKIMAQMKEQIKTPEKELSDEEIVNLSDAEFKTLVIRLLTEIIEFG